MVFKKREAPEMSGCWRWRIRLRAVFLWLFLTPMGTLGQSKNDPVLAVAQGITKQIQIHQSDLDAYLQENPTMIANQAVQNLVDMEVLAQLAERRNLLESVTVKDRLRQALATVYLTTVFEPKWSQDKVPESDTRRLYERHRHRVNHPDLVKPSHILVAEKKGDRMSLPDSPQRARASKDIAWQIVRALRRNPPKDDEAFRAAIIKYEPQVKSAGLEIIAEDIGFFGLDDGPFSRNMDPEFRRRSFATQTNEISDPFSTQFGWHVVRVTERKTAVSQSYEEAKPLIRARIYQEVRKRELQKLSASLAEQYPAVSSGLGIKRLIRAAPIFAVDQKRSSTTTPTATPNSQSP